MDIDSLLATLVTKDISQSDLFSHLNHEISYSEQSAVVLPENPLSLEAYTNYANDLFSAQNSLVTELNYTSTDSQNIQNEVDLVTGESYDDSGEFFIESRAANKLDNRIKTATDLDEISGKQLKINEKIGYKEGGKLDKYDYYSFSLPEDTELKITLDQLKQNANLNLFDEDGKTVLKKSTNQGKKSENITADLDAGTYYLRVSAAGQAKTPYRLSLEALPDDNTIDGANDLGKLSNKQLKIQDKIGYKENNNRDKIDIYSFKLTQEREVNITLNQLQQNANLKLIDEDGYTVLDKSTNKDKKSEKITEVLEPGTYYIEVSAQGNAKTNYQLSLDSEKIDNVVYQPEAENIYKAGTWVVGENRVGLKIPKGWIGEVTNNYDDTFILASPKKYPDVYVQVEGESYLTGSMQGLANNFSQPFEVYGVTLKPQGKAKIKGNQITNTYVTEGSNLQGKFYLVATVGVNNEIATVLAGGTDNKLKDYKDIVNNVVNNLDFSEPTDWESYLSDRSLFYYFNSDFLEFDVNFNGVIDPWEEYTDEETSDGIYLNSDRSFNRFYNHYNEFTGTTEWVLSGSWDLTNKDELALYYEDGSVSVKPLYGPDIDNEVIYADIVYSVKNIN